MVCVMQDANTIGRIRRVYFTLSPEMDERMRRQWAAAEAREIGWGGVTLVALACGLSRTTITSGLRELDQPESDRRAQATRVRRPGGGRQPLSQTDPELVSALEQLIDPSRAAIRSRPCGGLARARRNWRRN